MFLSPTEHKLAKYKLGKSHPACEENGVDVLITHRGRKLGVQRKAVPDLLASVSDGRLMREIGMMKNLDQAMVLVEGRMAFDAELNLLGNDYGRRWNKPSILGVLWSVRQKGIWVHHTDNLSDTVQTLKILDHWWKKDNHTSLETRPGPVALWGTSPTDRDFGVYVLQSLPGVGPELAGRVFDKFGIPFQWTITREDLMTLKGVGKAKADKMLKALEIEGENDGE